MKLVIYADYYNIKHYKDKLDKYKFRITDEKYSNGEIELNSLEDLMQLQRELGFDLTIGEDVENGIDITICDD